MSLTAPCEVLNDSPAASSQPEGITKKGKKGFNQISCFRRPATFSNLVTASRRFLPSRDDTRWRLVSMIRLFGLHETATILACPTWLVEGWLNGSGMLYGQQKRLIWWAWATFFAPWKLRSAFDIITSGRFVPDPATGEIGGLKAEWKRKARRKRKPGRKPRKRN